MSLTELEFDKGFLACSLLTRKTLSLCCVVVKGPCQEATCSLSTLVEGHVFIEVDAGVYYCPGLHGSCSSAHRPKGARKETVTKPITSTNITASFILQRVCVPSVYFLFSPNFISSLTSILPQVAPTPPRRTCALWDVSLM